jgi:2-polyprenyl-3-methyl-5-hydroxy-6-metoxy-1,4-benzoquinol methylase
MITNLSNPTIDKSSNLKRQRCIVCNYRISLEDISAFKTFQSNVRAFKDEKFKVWRCPSCETIHCLDVVDLAHYYSKYPFSKAKLNWTLRILYKNLYQQLTKQGLSKNQSILDYGCANGLFVEYLRQRGFKKCYGYDPYAPKHSFGNVKTLERGPFDYILLQDVIEHVEDPYKLLCDLDALLAPGGYIFIGTPNAAKIDLNQPHLSDYYNSIHAPYHLHIYTPTTLAALGRRQGWEPVEFCDRAFHDTPWFGLNTRAWNQYQRLFDGTLDVIYESLQLRKALTSFKFLFYAIFGYRLSLQTEMAMVFRKD